MINKTKLFIIALCTLGINAVAQQPPAKNANIETTPERFTLEEVATIGTIPWSMDFLPTGEMLTSLKEGELWLLNAGTRTKIAGTPRVWQNGQGGLLDVKVHPDYANTGWVYLTYSENINASDKGKATGMTAVVRGKITQGIWQEEQKIFSAAPKLHSHAGHHFGSRLVFDQGYIYFTIGDRGEQNFAQDLTRPNGKIFRLHDDGRIPSDNPFVQTPNALPGIWSYGHRNPQGLALDANSGLLWSAEHGPRGGDEINLIEKGKNYGWPVITYGINYDGSTITDKTSAPNMEQPHHYWVPSIAVSGIDFYTGKQFPLWQGKLLAASLAAEELHLLNIQQGRVISDDIIVKGKGRIREVNTGPDGNVYLLMDGGMLRAGKIMRLIPTQ